MLSSCLHREICQIVAALVTGTAMATCNIMLVLQWKATSSIAKVAFAFGAGDSNGPRQLNQNAWRQMAVTGEYTAFVFERGLEAGVGLILTALGSRGVNGCFCRIGGAHVGPLLLTTLLRKQKKALDAVEKRKDSVVAALVTGTAMKTCSIMLVLQWKATSSIAQVAFAFGAGDSKWCVNCGKVHLEYVWR
ncbi:hypothetical protein Efla_007681 [Eimeria flavescens]